jgi:hypothetical protein
MIADKLMIRVVPRAPHIPKKLRNVWRQDALVSEPPYELVLALLRGLIDAHPRRRQLRE